MKQNRFKKLVSLLLLCCLLLTFPLGALALSFTDVPEGAWFRDDVAFVYEQGLMNGLTATSFGPGNNLSRTMLVTILHRMAGEPAASFSPVFSDVVTGRFYTTAVMWAVQNNIVDGVGDGRFAPADNLTREQFAVMLHRFADSQDMDISVPATWNLNNFTDHAQISTWAATALRWANYNELITGVTTTTIVPRGAATRAQGAAIIHRFVTAFTPLAESPSYELLPETADYDTQDS